MVFNEISVTTNHILEIQFSLFWGCYSLILITWKDARRASALMKVASKARIVQGGADNVRKGEVGANNSNNSMALWFIDV